MGMICPSMENDRAMYGPRTYLLDRYREWGVQPWTCNPEPTVHETSTLTKQTTQLQCHRLDYITWHCAAMVHALVSPLGSVWTQDWPWQWTCQTSFAHGWDSGCIAQGIAGSLEVNKEVQWEQACVLSTPKYQDWGACQGKGTMFGQCSWCYCPSALCLLRPMRKSTRAQLNQP